MKNKFYLATATASAMALVLLTAAPALANDGNDSKGDVRASFAGDNGLHLGSVVSLFVHEDHATNTDQDNDTDNDGDNDHGHSIPMLNTHVGAGIVSSVNGTSFTVNPFRGAGTTTVITDASTTFKGGATSTSSLGIGSKVILVGNTSTTTPNTFMASIVVLIQNGFKGLRHFFFH